MRAGRQKGALPLIRKFNEHSERLLRSALCVSQFSDRRGDVDGAKFMYIGVTFLRLSVNERMRYEMHPPSSDAMLSVTGNIFSN